MSMKFISLTVLALGACLHSLSALAVPLLQLDIDSGVYDASPTEESTITTASVFDLYALGKHTSNKFDLSETYHISAALTPKTNFSFPDDDFGSFEVSYTDASGATQNKVIQVTADMTFGIPPLEANWDAAHDGGDLGSHDIYDTYFYELNFKFDAGSTVNSYNTEDDVAVSGTLLRETFSFDLTNLQIGYDLHFDLYSNKVKGGGDFDIDNFAPFSHDAGSQRAVPVPTPAGLLLLLVGLILVRLKAPV